jgi:hypothetical protein
VSYDRQLDQVCPHIVVNEALFVGDGNQIIHPLSPIASKKTVRVRLNGALEVPSYGAQLPVQSTGTKLEPFTIAGGVNDTFSYTVDQGPLRTITLPSAIGLDAAHIVAALNARVSGGLSFKAKSGRVQFRGQTEGRQGSVFISPGALADTLGISSNREYRGSFVAPGWTIISDQGQLEDRPTKLIVFDTPLKDYRPHVEITYNTVLQDCRRCGGLGYENDWRYGSNGEVGQVRQEALLLQQVQKLVFTVRGSNSFFSKYGTRITQVIGQKNRAGGLLQNMIVEDINRAFQAWQKMKEIQGADGSLSDEEYPYKLQSVLASEDPVDPTIAYIEVTVQNRSGRIVEIARGIKLPDNFRSVEGSGILRQSLSNLVLTG